MTHKLSNGPRFNLLQGRNDMTREEVAALANDPAFSHTRMGDGCWRDVVWIYHSDQDSPSGVTLAGATTKEVWRELKRQAPLQAWTRY